MNTDNKMDNKKKSNFRYFILLHLLLFVNSFGTVFGKLASKQEFMSFRFVLFYGLMIGFLFVYALCWQQILKHIPLTTAFFNKSFALIWSVLWGAVFFNETIKPNMIVGLIIVIIGVIFMVNADEH